MISECYTYAFENVVETSCFLRKDKLQNLIQEIQKAKQINNHRKKSKMYFIGLFLSILFPLDEFILIIQDSEKEKFAVLQL